MGASELARVPTTWARIRQGDRVLGGDGQAWEVTAHLAGTTTELTRPGAKHSPYTFTPAPDAPVVQLVEPLTETAAQLGRDPHELAEAVLAVHLGARPVADITPAGTRVPVITARTPLGDIRTHLFLFHGLYVADVKTRSGLDEAHAAGHDDPATGHYRPHTHDPNFRRTA